MAEHTVNTMKVRSLGIDTYRENIIFMHHDCHVCRSEGFTALTRVVVRYRARSIVATLNVVFSDLIAIDEAGLSNEAFKRLEVAEGDLIEILHLQPFESFSKVRAKMYGKELSRHDFEEIITDVVAGRYSNIQLASFITTCSGDNLSVNEIIGLTQSMISASERINWGVAMVMDKHSVGGLPGNRTTPIIVSIVAAAGLSIPKTSSRSITSPAGTADAVETMTRVNLSIEEIKRVVEKEGGCFAWGGAVNLSPADDILISVEKSLDIDSAGQMVASVISKKAAAGSTHTIIDIPVGDTAKVRSHEEALKLQYYFKAVAEQIGLNLEIMLTDGSQPVGRGIGPALEAADVLSVLRNEVDCPKDLKEKACRQSGALLELSGKFPAGTGYVTALRILESGKAYEKFFAICEAQGGFRQPAVARHRFDVLAAVNGTVTVIDNRKLARVAKLAGAPKSLAAGIKFFAPLGTQVKLGDILFTIYADTTGELKYAKDYVSNLTGLITIE